MQCKKCNAFIPEGFMYCPVCGEEIIIVSEFDNNYEHNIDTVSIAKTVELPDLSEQLDNIEASNTQETNNNKSDINSITDNDQDNKEESGHNIVEIKSSKKKKKINYRIFIFIGIGLALIALTVYIIYLQISKYNSFDYQFNKAISEVGTGDIDGAIATLKHAMTIDKTEESVILLAECYMKQANYAAALAVLFDSLEDFSMKLELYDRIVECYEAQGNSKGIHELIINSGDSNLALRYNDYISIAPTFSMEEGIYIEPDPVKLSAIGEGVIYYTTDGKNPDENSLQYIGPIPLEYGSTTIKAVYVNEKGIISDIVSRTFIVEMNIPDNPILLEVSGTKTIPELIGVNCEEGLTVYYTNNGTDPGPESKEYVTPFLMPLGKSEYRFVAYNTEGIGTDIVVGSYDLEMNATIETGVAEYAIAYQLMSKGENVIANTYVSEYGYKDENHIYYVISEYCDNNKTGRTFAVDIFSGELFEFIKNNDGTYSTAPL